MLHQLRSWALNIRTRLPAIIPSTCALCGASAGDAICDGCRSQFFRQHQNRCAQCAIALPASAASSGAICGTCLRQRPAFDATIVAADYAPPLDQLVLALKFGNRLELAPLMADMLRNALLQAQDLPLPTCLTAVPLGTQRLVERGFNQALEIAKPLSSAVGIGLHVRLATRQRETRAQALLPPNERRKNIRRAFLVPSNAIDAVRGMHVGIVDDVMTTGETLHELAATLKRFGAARVTNFVFARTPPD